MILLLCLSCQWVLRFFKKTLFGKPDCLECLWVLFSFVFSLLHIECALREERGVVCLPVWMYIQKVKSLLVATLREWVESFAALWTKAWVPLGKVDWLTGWEMTSSENPDLLYRAQLLVAWGDHDDHDRIWQRLGEATLKIDAAGCVFVFLLLGQ